MKWTVQEDAILQEGVEKQRGGENIDWMSIASKIRKREWDIAYFVYMYPGVANMYIISSKQCRERWVEYLNPAISRSSFTDEEDRALEELQIEHGNHWKVRYAAWVVYM